MRNHFQGKLQMWPLCEYLKCNKLKLNVKKCEFLVVGTRSKLNRLDPNIHLLVESIPILRVSSCKYLGVILDENLSWNQHINEIRRKVLFKLYILRRIRPIITQRQAELFYKSMIQCHFDYCDIVYANTGVTNLRKLQTLQNKSLKTVLRKDPRFPTDQLFILLKLDNILERFKKRTLIVMHQIFYNNAPNPILHFFEKRNPVYNTRHSFHNFALPKGQTNYKIRSLSYRGAKCWNTILQEQKSIENKNVLRKHNMSPPR